MHAIGERFRVIAVLATTILAAAQSIPAFATEIHEFRIPARQAAEAINDFASQAQVQILVAGDIIRDKSLNAVTGEFTTHDGLRRLLDGSGLEPAYVGDRSIALVKTASPESASASNEHHRRLRMAQNDDPSHRGEERGEGRSGPSSLEEYQPTAGRGIPEILVKGSKNAGSLNADIARTRDDVQPYVVLDQSAIRDSGATNVGDLLRSRLTMNYVPVQANQSWDVGSGNESVFALRGLSASQTLILIDGRRPGLRGVNGAELPPDLNAIPLSAIERIEVLPTTASGIYGGNATGGVINVVLKRQYSGLETSLTFENTFRNDGGNRRIDLNGGFSPNDGRTSILFSGSYSDSSPVLLRDRRFYGEYRDRFYANLAADPDSILGNGTPPLGATPNISAAPAFDFDHFLETGEIRFSVPNLTLKSGVPLNATRTFVPAGYGGAGADDGAALLGNAGRYNLDLADTAQFGGGRSSLLGGPETRSLSTTVRQQLWEGAEAFLELSASSNRSEFEQSPLVAIFDIPATSPNNPFEQDIRVNVPLDVNGQTVATKSEARRGLIGLSMSLARDWRAEIDFALDRTELEQYLPATSFAPGTAELVADGTIDVLSDTASVAEALASRVLPRNTITPTHSTQYDATIRAAGPVGALPGGRVIVTGLLEHRKESYGNFRQVYTDPFTGELQDLRFSKQSRTVQSAYVEARVPLISEANRHDWAELLEVQLAARYDEYDMNGGYQEGLVLTPNGRGRFSSIVPTVGFRFMPVDDLTFRASFGKGFLPPGLVQLQTQQPYVMIGEFLGLTDPRRGGEPVGEVLMQTGGNPDLDPEKSRSWSAGVILTPRAIPGLRVSIDWTRITKEDNITSVFLNQDVINNEEFLSVLFTREPAIPGDGFDVGPISGFNSAFLNATRAETESLDFSIDYSMQTERAGTWGVQLLGTRLVHNRVQVLPGTPLDERAGSFGSPAWSANATLKWQIHGNWDVAWSTRFLDGYWLNIDRSYSSAQGAARLSSEMYHDVVVGYRTGESDSILSNMEIRVGLKNVFDTKPRYLATFENLYDPWGSPALSTYYVTLRKAL